MKVKSIVLPRNLYIGENSLENIKEILIQLKLKKPLIITDKVMVDLGYVAKLTDSCKEISFEIFSGTEPEPSTTSIYKGVKFFKKNNHYDSIIALGGGSVMDSAKIISILCKNGGICRDYKFPYVVNDDTFPLIAIPTTAGTGSEATGVCVISDSETDEKMLMMGPSFMPSAAIIDYSLTMSLPARITADTGIDALTHAIEAYLSKKANLFSDAMALGALRLIGKNLESVYNDGNDIIAREAIMLGATLAGVAFSSASVGLVHGMSRPIGVFFHVPHGMSNAMLLSLVLENILTDESRSRFAECYKTMGYDFINEQDGIDKFLLKIKQITQKLQVPTLSQFGVEKEEYFSKIEIMTEQALASGSPGNSPKALSKEEIMDLYKKLWA
jgi:alcohol dehydrogenase class IV